LRLNNLMGLLLRSGLSRIVHGARGPTPLLVPWPRPRYTPSCPKNIRTIRFAIRCNPVINHKCTYSVIGQGCPN